MPLRFLCPRCGDVQEVRGLCPSCERSRTRSRLRTEPWRGSYRTGRWARARAHALARDGHRCTRCGGGERLEVHHVRPLADGGSAFELDNLVTLCSSCHHGAEAKREPHLTPLRHRDDVPAIG
jgi:5-methylcytosine-specific restriction endonuclease McrA